MVGGGGMAGEEGCGFVIDWGWGYEVETARLGYLGRVVAGVVVHRVAGRGESVLARCSFQGRRFDQIVAVVVVVATGIEVLNWAKGHRASVVAHYDPTHGLVDVWG